MKNWTILIFTLIILFSCGKKTIIKGRVYNAVTNEGITGIGVFVLKQKNGLGYDGSGTKTVFTTVTDEQGMFVIDARFRKSKEYYIRYSFDLNDYYLIRPEIDPAGQDYNNDFFQFPLIGKGKLQMNFKNNNCFNENDLFKVALIPRFQPQYTSNLEKTGCYIHAGSINDSPQGWYVCKGTVTKNNITTPYADSIYVTEGGYHVWNIEY